jgi:hypothetical protein
VKKTFGSKMFAAAAAALLVVGAGCASAPVQQDQPAAEMPPTVETTSNMTSEVTPDTSLPQEAAPTEEPMQTPDSYSETTPSSLGASSSGRGH